MSAAGLSRRDLMASLSAGAVAALGAASSARAAGRRFFTEHDLPIGLQLYTLGDGLKTDLDGTLSQVARIGYRTVEMAGLLGRTPTDLRGAFDRAGLRCTSAHIPAHAGAGELSLGDNLDGVIKAAQAIGFRHVVLPSPIVPERITRAATPGEPMAARLARVQTLMSADDWRANADFLNKTGAVLKTAGLQLAYHNHNLEFAPVGGTDGLDLLIRNTDPALVQFEMDVGWVVAGGRDPVALIDAYAGRFRMMHVKDVKSTTVSNFAFRQDPADVGHGEVDWRRLLPIAYRAGVRDYFLEQEAPFDKSRIDSVRVGFDYLNSLTV